MKAACLNRGGKWFALIAGAFAAGSAPRLTAAELDPAKLPPAANIQIDFARDIRRILETSCFRCHGPEKPKNGFRLDIRERALKGGDDGVDIVPGHSDKSPLIYYVARLVPDKEMPPEGKGEALSDAQVGLLRAWIDQGVVWDAAVTNLSEVTVSPTIGGVIVKGNEQKFRELNWQPDGLNGGLERFDVFQQSDPDTTVSASGHALLHDYRVQLEMKRNELGFIHMGWDEYRQYYNNVGGYPPPPSTLLPQSLGTDLSLDLGKAWVDLGLTLPSWPRMVLGYEYDYKHGQEAITSWGSDGVAGDPRNIAPASKYLDEGTHLIKFDFNAELGGVSIEDRFRGEFYKLDSSYTNVAARGAIAQNVNNNVHYFQGANSIRLEKKFASWLLTSGGYFYSQLNSAESFTDATVNNSTLYLAAVPNLMLSRESHVFNVNGLVGPFEGLTLSGGLQSEWTRQEGMGSGELNGIAYTRPPSSNLAIDPATLAANYDQNTISETAGLRFTKIPFTTLFADSRWQQETLGQTSSDLQPGTSFLEDTAYESRISDFRAGFSSSPWPLISFDGHYRRYEHDSHFDTNQIPQPVGGYPGFISRLDLVSDEFEAKIILHPSAWLKTTFSYQYITTDNNVETRTAFSVVPPVLYSPGGPLLAGKTDSHVYSLGATLAPWRRLSLSGTFSYQRSLTETADSNLIPPYQGDIYSALLSGSYILNQSTIIYLNYAFSLGDYTASNVNLGPNTPPPLGISYQQHAVQVALGHQFTKNLSTRLQYTYYYYDEPSASGVNNYKANAIFGTLTYRFR